MASTYSSSLRLELIATGEQANTWGSTTNTNLGTLIEQAISGYSTVNMATDADRTLTTSNGASDESRPAALKITSSGSLSVTRNIIVPTVNKLYSIKNATTGGQSLLVKTAAGTGITIPNGETATVICDGTNVVYGFTPAGMGIPTSYAATAISNTPAGGISATNVQAAINELDTEKAKSGANSDITSLSGITTALSVGQGGTGTDTLSANAVLLGNGASAVQSVAPSTSGNVLTSNGTSWVSTAPAGASSFPSGTRMPFNQTSAPTGWTKDTSFNDALMRVVSGSVGSGGSTAFSTFNGQSATGAHTLTSSEIANHTHDMSLSSAIEGSFSAGEHISSSGTNAIFASGTAGGSITVGAAGGGTGHSHSLTHAIKYNDFIIAVKD